MVKYREWSCKVAISVVLVINSSGDGSQWKLSSSLDGGESLPGRRHVAEHTPLFASSHGLWGARIEESRDCCYDLRGVSFWPCCYPVLSCCQRRKEREGSSGRLMMCILSSTSAPDELVESYEHRCWAIPPPDKANRCCSSAEGPMRRHFPSCWGRVPSSWRYGKRLSTAERIRSLLCSRRFGTRNLRLLWWLSEKEQMCMYLVAKCKCCTTLFENICFRTFF